MEFAKGATRHPHHRRSAAVLKASRSNSINSRTAKKAACFLFQGAAADLRHNRAPADDGGGAKLRPFAKAWEILTVLPLLSPVQFSFLFNWLSS
jgi:hypothetical protein